MYAASVGTRAGNVTHLPDHVSVSYINIISKLVGGTVI